jgi:DNA-binding MarR family transcriptional regulator
VARQRLVPAGASEHGEHDEHHEPDERDGGGLLAILLDFAQAHRERLAEHLARLGLTTAQARTLYYVDSAPTVRELAVRLKCDASYVTVLVDRLEEQRLMRRRVSPSDRRIKMLTLTAAGRRLQRQVARAMDDPPGLEGLSADEKRQLSDLLRKATAV